MPIYEYVCESCEHAFEKLMKRGAEPPPCEECGSDQVKKKISAPSFVLKGGGWYKDHYGLKGKKADTKSDGAASSGGTGGDAAKKLDTMQKAASKAKSGGSDGGSAKKTSTKGKA